MDYIKWIRSKVGHDNIFLNFAGACIENEQGEILLQKRGDKNKWGFPGGALELGESAEEAVVREIREGTGYEVQVEYLIGVYTKYSDSYANGDQAQPILFFFKCIISGGALTIDHNETIDLQFFKRNATPLLVNKQHEDCLRDYLSGKKGCFR